MIIAIDGPAGAGKSTIAKLLAKKLNYKYLDTGALYRAIAYKVLKQKIDPNFEKEVLELAKKAKIKVNACWKNFKVFLDGENVTNLIRSEEISDYTRTIAKFENLRKILRKIQRKIGKNKKIVIEGRDIGTVVFPKAEFKFYIDATVEERAKRRYYELLNKKENASYDSILNSIIKRDKMDKERHASPLRKHKNAIHIDTTSLSPREIVRIIYEIIKYPYNLKKR